MNHIQKMVIAYIESCDDESFLMYVILEKHYDGRDMLTIAVELELLDII